MTNTGVVRRVHAGSTPEPVALGRSRVFDICFGADAHELPKWPTTMDFTSAGWADGQGHHFGAERLGDLWPEAAHQPFQEDPDKFNARLETFWESIQR